MKASLKVEDPNVDSQIVKAYQGVIEKYPTSKSAPNATMRLAQIFRQQNKSGMAAIYYELYRTKYFDSSKNDYRMLKDLAVYYEKSGAASLAADAYVDYLGEVYKNNPNSPTIPSIVSKIDKLRGATK